MAKDRTVNLMDCLRKAVLAGGKADRTDGQLLEDYVSRRDEAAVAALVRRHGPMVWGVCRRVLHDYHDAEDAFQATFLVLVRKAASIVPRAMVGNWLYGVAHQTALKARATAAKRRARERQVKDMPEPAARPEPDLWDDLEPLLDQELSRLPDKYRVAIVLCDLEGKTRKEAARQLKSPKERSRARLGRGGRCWRSDLLGTAWPCRAVALAAALSQKARGRAGLDCFFHDQGGERLAAGQAAAAGVVSAKVAALTKGVLKTMLLNKLKAVTISVLLIALLGLGGGAFAWRGLAAEYPGRQAGKETTPGKDDDLKKKLLELDEQWWKGDVEMLRKLAADDLITVSGVGRYDKAALLEASKNRHAADWTRRDVEVSRVSKDVAVVTYVYDCKIVLSDGTPVQNCRDRRLSMTWVKRDGGWVVVFSQETILPGGD